jgi:outer membrane protein
MFKMIPANYKSIALLAFCAANAPVINAQNLVEAYQLAFKNDHQLKASYYTQFAVAETKNQSIAQMLPTLSLSGRGSFNRLDNSASNFQGSGVQNYWDYGFTLNLSQPIFHWDHWIQLDQSDNRTAQAEAEYESDHQDLIALTTETYFDILSAQDSLTFAIAEQRAIARQLEQAKQRYDVGLVAITDVLEAQAAFDEARADQIQAENELYDRKEALVEIIGDADVNLAKLSKPINFTPPKPNDIKEWERNAETRNLKIIASLNKAEIIRKDVSIQNAGHMPTLDAVASYGMQSTTSSFGLRGDTQNIGLQLNVPLFQGGLVTSKTQQSQFNLQAAKEELLGTKRKVKRQVRDAFRDVTSSISRVYALKAAVASAESALEATEAGFSVGTRTMVDVLAEQRNLYRSKRDHSRSLYDYLINGVKLKQATSSLTEKDLALIDQYLES